MGFESPHSGDIPDPHYKVSVFFHQQLYNLVSSVLGQSFETGPDQTVKVGEGVYLRGAILIVPPVAAIMSEWEFGDEYPPLSALYMKASDVYTHI